MKMFFKKICALFAFIFCCTCTHASIIFRIDASAPGAFGYRYENCFDIREPVKKSTELGFGNISLSLHWEFNSHDEKRLHFFVGADAGYFYMNFPVTLTFGTMYQLFQTKKLTFELSGELKAGIAFNWWGGTSYYLQPSVDFVMMGKSRKGFYGGLGLSTIHTWNAIYYQDFGWYSRWNWFAGPHAYLGVYLNLK